MDFQKPIIKFYQKRTFGEKMTVSFNFMRENFKPLFKLCLYFLLPVTIIQGIFLKGYMGSYISGMAMQTMLGGNPFFSQSLLINYIGMIVMSFLASAIIMAITFTCIQKYNETKSLKEVTFTDLKEGLITNFKKSLITNLVLFGIILGVCIILVILGFGIASITVGGLLFFLFIAIIAMLALLLPTALIAPVYIFEDTSIGTAIKKGFSLGFKSWGGLFGICFVMGLIAQMIQGVVAVPWFITIMLQTIFTLESSTSHLSESFALSIAQYISNVVMLFFAYAAFILVILGISYHYSSANEVAEAVSINEDLKNFEEL